MDFPSALTLLTAGHPVARMVWRDDRRLEIWRQTNGVGRIKQCSGYAYGRDWRPSNDDLLADGWAVYTGQPGFMTTRFGLTADP